MLLGEKEGTPQCSDENVRLSSDRGKVRGAGVGDGDGAIGPRRFAAEENGEGSSDDLAAANDDGVLPGGGDLAKTEYFQNSGWCAGKKTGGIADEELAEIDGMETIDVFGGGYAGVHDVVGQARRERGLDEDAVDFWIGVEGVDFLEEGGKRGGFGENESAAGNSDFLGPCFLARDVGAGGGILADSDEDEAQGDASISQGGNAGGGGQMDLGGEGFAVEDAGGHIERVQGTGKKWKKEEVKMIDRSGVSEGVFPIQAWETSEVPICGDPGAIVFDGEGGMPSVGHQLAASADFSAKVSKDGPMLMAGSQNHSVRVEAEILAKIQSFFEWGGVEKDCGVRHNPNKPRKNCFGESKVGGTRHGFSQPIGKLFVIGVPIAAVGVDQDIDIAENQGADPKVV